MGKIVPFYAADQGICDTLCDIIRALSDALQHEKALELTDKQVEIYNRITEGS